MQTDEEIKRQVEKLRGRNGELLGKDEQRKTVSAVKKMREIIEANGHDEPTASDYDEYRRQSEATDQSKGYQTTNQSISRIRRYFSARKESEQLMIENEEYTPAESEPLADEPETIEGETIESEAADAAPVMEEDPRKPAKNKGGRKRMDANGEKRDQKNTVYLTATMDADFKALCSLKHISVADYLFGLVASELGKYENALRFFREGEKLV